MTKRVGNPSVLSAVRAIEYAANCIESPSRRGVFIKAFVEEEQWALDEFRRWETMTYGYPLEEKERKNVEPT